MDKSNIFFFYYIHIVNVHVRINAYRNKYLFRYYCTVEKQNQNVNNANPSTELVISFAGITLKSTVAFGIGLIAVWVICLYTQSRVDLMETQNVNIVNHFT